MHRLLQRQLKRNLGKDFHFPTLDETIINLLKDISSTYDDNDNDRKFLEHTITVNTEELNTLLKERSSLLESRTQENQDVINLLHQYKNAIDESLIVSTIDLDGIIRYVNENFCKISEYAKEELIGKSHNIVKDEINDNSIFENMLLTIKSKKTWNAIVSNMKKSGEIYYLNMTFVPLLDRNKNINEVISLSVDVTQQIVYQEELKSQRERISTVFNNQENIVVIVDEKNGIVDANKRFFETFNFLNLDEYKRKIDNFSKLFDINNEYSNSALDESLWFQQFVEKSETLYKISRIDKDGNNQIFSIRCTKTILSSKPHYLCTLIDITELENARQKAEIAQKAKSIFLANMSHEIRTPLNAIMGFSNILSESNIDIEHKENAKIISRSAKSLLGIINDVLDISKIESGKLDLFNESFLFESFLENIVELFSVASKEKRIRFIYSPDSILPYSLVSDSIRLQQILSNLLSNAIKFTPEYGEIIFTVKFIERIENKAKIRFSIKDNGIGMSQEQQRIIFNPFSQADDGISRKFGGTGLGLSICSDIIKLMNSKIELISNINEGSEFSFNLDFEIDKFKNDKKTLDNNFKFLLYCSEGNNNILKENVENHINKLGQVFDYDKSDKKGDILFCCGNGNLEFILKEFKQNNQKSFIIFIGDENNINECSSKNYINHYLNLPIYGSKLFNIISENLKLNSIVIKKVSTANVTFKGKILIAEDNLNNQKLIQILLNKLGLESTIVSNGEEAFFEYKREKYDLILMDINMPIMDGLSATKEIRNFEKYLNYNIPIIALTANSIAGDKEKYLSQGMDDYLSKPIEFDILVNILEKYLLNDSSIQVVPSKIDLINISKKLELPYEVVQKLYSLFKKEIMEDLKQLEYFIINNNKDEIAQKLYYIKNSCLIVGLDEAVEILQNMQNQLIENKDELIRKLNKIISYSCDL
ncbi:ATP-binding protein [Arcobacter sp. s6]|uniref:ATP-binding protein n=1 Tax=Arcobacter sp. s6 TaxID=3230363 RepID=UPI00349FD963